MNQLTKRKLQQHACRLYDYGETATYRYMVMQLLGRSLSELRKSATKACLSASTTVRVGIQCLEAIETLHKIGFLHRDVKPGNFAMGLDDADKRTVFLLDFGLCRQYIAPDGQLRPARKSAGFRGTVRYASINTHMRKELGRHDDLWSLFYMIIELRTGELPWTKLHDKDAVSVFSHIILRFSFLPRAGLDLGLVPHPRRIRCWYTVRVRCFFSAF